jgi:hypothetical protein
VSQLDSVANRQLTAERIHFKDLPGLAMYFKQGKTIFGAVNLVEEILLM